MQPFEQAWALLKQELVQNVNFTGRQLTPEQQLEMMQYINNLGIGPAAVASNQQQGLPPPQVFPGPAPDWMQQP